MGVAEAHPSCKGTPDKPASVPYPWVVKEAQAASCSCSKGKRATLTWSVENLPTTPRTRVRPSYVRHNSPQRGAKSSRKSSTPESRRTQREKAALPCPLPVHPPLPELFPFLRAGRALARPHHSRRPRSLPHAVRTPRRPPPFLEPPHTSRRHRASPLLTSPIPPCTCEAMPMWLGHLHPSPTAPRVARAYAAMQRRLEILRITG